MYWLSRAALAPALLGVVAGCNSSASSVTTAPPAAKTQALAHETELLKIELSEQAEQRLGIATAALASGSSARTRKVHGEIVIAPTGGGVPIGSTTDLSVLATTQAAADGAVARARAELEIAESTAARAEALVREEAGSARARDESLSALAVARANLRTAKAQRDLQGEPVAALGRQGTYWLRVSVFASDLGSINRAAPATVRSLGSGNYHPRTANPVNAPPSANVAAGTVDLYYALDRQHDEFQVGQRVAVEVPLTGSGATGAVVPASAIVTDIYGGEWVYVQTAPLSYERRRIEVATSTDGPALVKRGPGVGALVVVAGAAELFGNEFGAK